MKQPNKTLVQIAIAIIVSIFLMALGLAITGSPGSYAKGYDTSGAYATNNTHTFKRELISREDGRYSSVCSWDYKDQKITWNVQLGVCFEDHSALSDNGFRYEDGSANFEYAEFVGMRNADRSINEWVVKDNAERKKVTNGW